MAQKPPTFPNREPAGRAGRVLRTWLLASTQHPLTRSHADRDCLGTENAPGPVRGVTARIDGAVGKATKQDDAAAAAAASSSSCTTVWALTTGFRSCALSTSVSTGCPTTSAIPSLRCSARIPRAVFSTNSIRFVPVIASLSPAASIRRDTSLRRELQMKCLEQQSPSTAAPSAPSCMVRIALPALATPTTHGNPVVDIERACHG